MTEPTDTSAGEAMPDERLAEIRTTSQRDRYQHEIVLGDCTDDCGACAVKKLLAEVERLREAESLATAQLGQVGAERAEWRARAERGDAIAKLRRAEHDAATERAETAERALEEMRERIERVRRRARNPRVTQGYVRDYVYAKDILALLDEGEAVDGG